MVGTLLAILQFILSVISVPPTAIYLFVKSNLTLSAVGFALAAAVLVSTITAKSFGFYLRDLIYQSLRFVYYLSLQLFRGKTVLVLCDADAHNVVARKFARSLRQEAKCRGSKIRTVVISSGSAIVGFPLLPILIKGIALIVTDVTPLSVETKRRELIQRRLVTYAMSGGTLLLFHDTLYRRTRNELLQKLAGGRITHFSAISTVDYMKHKSGAHSCSNKLLCEELPEAFTLSDKELIQGDWDESVEFLYVKVGTSDTPLVTRRECGEGTVFWLHSGDTDRAGPAGSISIPELALIGLVEKLIRLGGSQHPSNPTL